jgi:squalene-hopene/tetraprenyl-beta-curcumene cyclase
MTPLHRLFTLSSLFLVSVLPSASSLAGAPLQPQAKACLSEPVRAASKNDPQIRATANKGLSFLAQSSRAWTQQHRCFGCHVQAVTMEALSVGKKHQYTIASSDLSEMVRALKLGVTAGGHTTGIAFEGSAWARYDQWVGNNETNELLRYAGELLAVQAADGAINDDDRRLPVTGGTLETTFQAAQTWRQAYARTADEKWLSPMRRAESYLVKRSASFGNGKNVYLQDINFSLLGLLASGVTRTESSAHNLIKMLLDKQNQDGGWGLDANKSDAFATGQTVYALKLAGYSDSDVPVARGIRFLASSQDQSGAWRTYKSGQGGSEKAETMWAVLGLVTVDVASLTVSGLTDGQHVEPKMTLGVSAADNQGAGIKQLEVLLDDRSLHTECGAKLTYTLDTAGLPAGKHIIDLVAVTDKGQRSVRRFTVYAGDVFMTELGAQFDEKTQASVVSLRNIAPQSEQAGSVELEVYSVKDSGKDSKDSSKSEPKDRVFVSSKKGQVGGLAFGWNGNGTDGKSLPMGRYVAKLLFRDSAGKVRQSDSTVFFHGNEAAQRSRFAEVEGQIALKGGSGSANTVVELVDKAGNVVQATRTTEQGNYRFKTVDKGEYRVRARKIGFADLEQSVQAAPAAAPAKASMAW